MSYADSNFILSYTDHGDYGSFPQAYGDLHVDNVAGNYTYGDYSGTFAGTMITEVDAYGDMITSEGTFDVTRLKTVQTLQLSYAGLGIVGMLSQTTYRYYRESDLWPLVKSTNNVLTVGLLGINSDTTQIEKAPAAIMLSANNPLHKNEVAITPNPVGSTAEIVAAGQNVISVVITDISGKIVFSGKGTPILNLSNLTSGNYIAKIETQNGVSFKKIIKQ
ncbi:T9SS type A sorting domain-containing protein [Flavobacterium sp. 3HN19-14]|uniref:T9SS type A sorting domain-containing protein n=1 Tax=Flavobacterium sp. 3HN19-14 TaxID=3448133 RepID=UPI003EE0B874